MKEYLRFYINGTWVDPFLPKLNDVINPSSEKAIAVISMGSPADVNVAVQSAKTAFFTFSKSSKDERIDLFERIIACYKDRFDEIATMISEEMGAPLSFAKNVQAQAGLEHFLIYLKILKTYSFEEFKETVFLKKEPIGVCALITPWNWPMNQVCCKVAAALAAGCCMVLKPSEIAPLNAIIFAEILDKAGVPKGVFNLVQGEGSVVGEALAKHPDVDMVSFTGSTKAGILVAKNAADNVKRVSQELGGKSPNIILEDADLKTAVSKGVFHCFNNSGQSCDAPTRMFIPSSRYKQALEFALMASSSVVVGDPKDNDSLMGPLVSQDQFDKLQAYIQLGIDEGARLLTGGLGRPEGLNKGFYVKPTIFCDVKNEMKIAQEEIFGPVLCILSYDTLDEAIYMANDTNYGLAAYVSGSQKKAERVALDLKAGRVCINGKLDGFSAPFGGYKQSGNGKEWGIYGLEEFLEIKSVLGYQNTFSDRFNKKIKSKKTNNKNTESKTE